MFNERVLGEIPTTDPKSLVNRVLEVSLADVIGNPSKFYIKFRFKVDRVEGSKAFTTFDGYAVIKEQIFRMVRKRLQKVEVIRDVETKDGWKLHMKAIIMLNRNTDTNLQRKVRLKTMDILTDFTSKTSLDDLIKTISNNILQKNIKKQSSKIYPVRSCEVVRIGVLGMPKK
jgi:small subunit ribosomal protein S3Ae